MNNLNQPDVIIFMTDEERAIPPYETPEVIEWRDRTLAGRNWFKENGVSFNRHYTVLWHVYRVARRFLPVNFQMYTVSPRLTV